MGIEVYCTHANIQEYADEVKQSMLKEYKNELEDVPLYFVERLCENYAWELLGKEKVVE